MFKHIVLSVVAISFLAVPMAQAQQRHPAPQQGQHFNQPQKPNLRAPVRPQVQRAQPQRHQWTRGQRVSDWQRRPVVRDYHRHGLKRPATGQQWVKVDNDFLLISLATGIIAGIAASR